MYLEGENGLLVVGTVNDGFGAHTANVLALNDPAQWIADALVLELQTAGYEVGRTDGTSTEGATRGLEVIVRNVFVDQDTGMLTIGAISTLDFDVRLMSGANEVETFTVRYNADFQERGLGGVGSLKAAALKEALELALAPIMPRILTALKDL